MFGTFFSPCGAPKKKKSRKKTKDKNIPSPGLMPSAPIISLNNGQFGRQFSADSQRRCNQENHYNNMLYGRQYSSDSQRNAPTRMLYGRQLSSDSQPTAPTRMLLNDFICCVIVTQQHNRRLVMVPKVKTTSISGMCKCFSNVSSCISINYVECLRRDSNDED